MFVKKIKVSRGVISRTYKDTKSGGIQRVYAAYERTKNTRRVRTCRIHDITNYFSFVGAVHRSVRAVNSIQTFAVAAKNLNANLCCSLLP